MVARHTTKPKYIPCMIVHSAERFVFFYNLPNVVCGLWNHATETSGSRRPASVTDPASPSHNLRRDARKLTSSVSTADWTRNQAGIKHLSISPTRYHEFHFFVERKICCWQFLFCHSLGQLMHGESEEVSCGQRPRGHGTGLSEVFWLRWGKKKKQN